MSAPLPIAAFPIGGKAGPAAAFATAVLIGLAIYAATRAKQPSPTVKTTR